MPEKIIKYLGIDWGEKRIGLAAADSETRTAVPYGVAGSMEELLSAIKGEGTDVLVVGTPVSLSGQAPDKKSFTDFINTLKIRSGLPLDMVDERLSSKAADALTGDKKTKAPRDAVAAMLILQGFLDKL
ncbi:MAG: Holliday junction resolvase RuvX [Planctomycetes bacterium]|jgi:putative Holliday junction resolvase|nr:Holliday junction resolvase RuvX [Planctomycetota bacterium]